MPNPDIYLALDELERSEICDDFFRRTAPSRQPLSGRGAGLTGGRWNPRGLETVYLARPLDTCRAEFVRMAEGQGAGPASFLPRTVHTVTVTGLTVADLTAAGALATVGLSNTTLAGSYRACQQIGDAANTLGFGGVLAPSAVSKGEVLAVFTRRDVHKKLTVQQSRQVENEEWS